MNSPHSLWIRGGLVPCGLLMLVMCASALGPAYADTATHPVTATPPLQVVPTGASAKNVQQRMRACNAGADAKKLQSAPRETFIKGCMAAHHARPLSRPGSQPKPNP